MATITFPNVITPAGAYAYATQDLGLDNAVNDVEDGADDSEFPASDNDLLVVHNSTGAPINLTVVSVADQQTGRTAASDVYAIPAGKTHIFGPLKRNGWAAAGKITMQASAVGLRAAVLKL